MSDIDSRTGLFDLIRHKMHLSEGYVFGESKIDNLKAASMYYSVFQFYLNENREDTLAVD